VRRWPIDAFLDALDRECALRPQMHEYAEHSAGGGAGARAVAQVERDVVGGGRAYGVGVHASIVRASLLAVVSTVNRAFPRPGGLARVLHAARPAGWPGFSMLPVASLLFSLRPGYRIRRNSRVLIRRVVGLWRKRSGLAN